MIIKKKKCKVCPTKFEQHNSLQQVCSVKCAIVLTNRQKSSKAKQQRKAYRLKREALRPRSWYVKRMIQAFNVFIRTRDKNKPCISCGRQHIGVYHSGHYLTTKARPWLAVHPANASKQCYACNVPLSGNISEYRPMLIKKVGISMVEYLENCHSSYILTVEDMVEITAHYRNELKLLKQE